MHKKILEKARTVDDSIELVEHQNQYTLVCNNKKTIIPILVCLKDDEQICFDMLLDITAIDWLDTKPSNRFELVYFLYSNKNKNRIRIKVPINNSSDDGTTNQKHFTAPSVSSIYPSADWYEREV